MIPSLVLWPAMLWPPARTASSRPDLGREGDCPGDVGCVGRADDHDRMAVGERC